MLRLYFRVPLLWLLFLLSFSTRSSLAAPVQIDHMVVFGDSLSDNGNLYSILHLPAPPTYALGRSTDGPATYPASAISGMWEEQLAPSMGLPVPQPNLVNAADLNFAFAGAETGELANSVTGPYGMAAQVQSYLGQKPANIATALHLFWGGTNDLFDYPDPLSAEQNAVRNISNQIASIAAAGGQNFVWLNLPPLDLSPRGAGSAGIGTASASFATDMQGAISSLQASYPGITIISVDIYSLFKQVIQTPSQYGLTNVTTQAQSYPVNPDQYIFWDYLHPTTKMHQLIAGLVRGDITRVLDLPSAPTKLPVSDDFTSAGLNTDLWTVEAPPDATVTVTSGHSILSLPGGVNHDAFVGDNNSVRILQPVSNVDFDVAAKFDTVLSAAYQGQGILVQQDTGTYLRFEVGSDGAELFLSGASVSGGTETNHFSIPLHGVDSSLWLEVKRSSDIWTLSIATDGVNYSAGGTFSQSITVTGIGAYAFNYNSYAPAAPATSSAIDFFHNLSAQ